MLVERGADVNASWRKTNALTYAEMYGRQEIAEYLRSQGYVLPGERTAAQPPPLPANLRSPASRERQIVDYFAQRYGKVQDLALREIIPATPSVAIHAVPATAQHNHLILFTTGMSSLPLTAPRGAEAYQLAELLICLPANWPLTSDALRNPDYFWPIEWLRRIAHYAHQNKTWLGAPVTIIANGDPPQPFAPHVLFTAMLLAVGLENVGPVPCSDGRPVQLYTLMPLYAEERRLEMTQGLPALFQRFERQGVTKVVHVNRPNVALLT